MQTVLHDWLKAYDGSYPLPTKSLMLKENIIDAVGRTPLVNLTISNDTTTIFGKMELLNPFGMKDRVAKRSILEARRQGILKPDAPIVESSSGTMALGVGLVGTYLGHDVHIVTDPRIDPITKAKLETMGCVLHIVDKMTSHGWQSARLERLNELFEKYPDAFWPRQYDNPDNPLSYQELACELLSEINTVDILVGSVGSGGSLCGTARALRKHLPNLHVIGIDAVGSAIFGQPDYPKRLQSGLGNSLIPPNVDHTIIDEIHWLSDEEAFAATLHLAQNEKIFAGNSSGSVYAVLRWLSQTRPNNTIVGIFPDRGDRYIDTIYNAAYRKEHGIDNLHIPQAPAYVDCTATVTSWSYTTTNQHS